MDGLLDLFESGCFGAVCALSIDFFVVMALLLTSRFVVTVVVGLPL